MNTMVRLIYVSRMARGLGSKELESIVGTSRRKNQQSGITGALCYSTRGFLQCLEGPSDVVNELYGHIIRDKRHVDVTLLAYSDIHQRSFAKWVMAYIRVDEADDLIVRKYIAEPAFDPFAMSGQQALGFLAEIAVEREKALGK